MKTSEIRIEANKIITDIFGIMITSPKKEDWKKGFQFIDTKISKLENGARGEEMFIWRKVKCLLNNKFGDKFIIKK